jgi:hypothetical protein
MLCFDLVAPLVRWAGGQTHVLRAVRFLCFTTHEQGGLCVCEAQGRESSTQTSDKL